MVAYGGLRRGGFRYYALSPSLLFSGPGTLNALRVAIRNSWTSAATAGCRFRAAQLGCAALLVTGLVSLSQAGCLRCLPTTLPCLPTSAYLLFLRWLLSCSYLAC